MGVKIKETEPTKTGIAYKLFFLKDGKLYPPMVQNPDGADTPMNIWIDASAKDVIEHTVTGRPQIQKGGKGTHSTSKGLLAYRPGWHLGEIPLAHQFDKINPETGKKELFPATLVWAECEYTKDIDYQQQATAAGYTKNGAYRHSYAGLQQLPENGFYKYRTNPNPNTEQWIITGSIKINKILTNEEVDQLVKKAGKQVQLRESGSFGEIEQKVIDQIYSQMKDTSLAILFENSSSFSTVITEKLEQSLQSLEPEKALKLKSLWDAKFRKDSKAIVNYLEKKIKHCFHQEKRKKTNENSRHR